MTLFFRLAPMLKRLGTIAIYESGEVGHKYLVTENQGGLQFKLHFSKEESAFLQTYYQKPGEGKVQFLWMGQAASLHLLCLCRHK